jgi:hypothetical protein
MKLPHTRTAFLLPAVLTVGWLLIGCERTSSSAQSQASSHAAQPANKIDYGRDVQPILSNYCYHCHGPDTASRKAGLRLDLREKALAFKKKEGTWAIVPGKPEESELVRRIESHDPDEMMPQNKDKLLNQAQIKLLRDWIAQGAEFRDHWAFEAPVRQPLPGVKDKAWGRNVIDAFVLARLEEKGLKPNKEADKATLIRRATLDLTGLLPTPKEITGFMADASPNAYEKVLDRLLASPRYGEQRGRHWLDYARYGDTAGLFNDKFMGRWPYRDYVIASFNSDMPYDRFTREQLAGDLLPVQTADSLVATGFVRNGVSTGEGGTLLEELRVNNARERMEAFGAVYMGMTTGCAVCHDHKYDPLTQHDFYALSAFFNNIAEISSNEDTYNWPPSILVPLPQNKAAYDKALAQKVALEQQIVALQNGLETEIAAWRTKGGAAQAVSDDGLIAHLRLDENRPDDPAPPVGFINSAPKADRAPIATSGAKPLWGEDTHLWPTFRLGPNTVANLGNLGDFDTAQALSAGGWFKPKQASFKNNGTSATGALLAKMDGAAPHRGWNLAFDQGVAMVQLISNWPGDAISVSTTTAVLPRGEWTHVCFTHDGSGKAAGIKIYVNGVLQPVKVQIDTLKGSILTQAPLYLGRRHPDAFILQEAGYQDVRVYGRALSADEAARLPYEDEAAAILKAKPADRWSADERLIVSRFYFSRANTTVAGLQAQIAKLDTELAALSKGGPVSLICREAPTLPYADVLGRGAFAARIGRVGPSTPHFLPPMPKDAPRNRKGLADWVLSPENPLTARVAVNRMWQEIFGIGLAETSEDFGIVGERPVNQALLDFLALDFRENGWAVKRMYKTMLMSTTYRQSSKANPAAYDDDAKNQLLARGPRFRMDAEMIRDSALQAAGLLVEKLGGPSVRPYQPPGVWEAGSQSPTASDSSRYTQDHGESLYRRSLYTVWKRLAIMPDMEAFDAPDRQISCVRRPRTNTPMGALVLFNNVQLLEAARFLGLRSIREGGGSDEAKLNFLSQTVLARSLDAQELATLKQSLAEFRKAFATKPADATELLKQGEKPKASDLPDVDQAVWMMAAHQFFNFDAFLNK